MDQNCHRTAAILLYSAPAIADCKAFDHEAIMRLTSQRHWKTKHLSSNVLFCYYHVMLLPRNASIAELVTGLLEGVRDTTLSDQYRMWDGSLVFIPLFYFSCILYT